MVGTATWLRRALHTPEPAADQNRGLCWNCQQPGTQRSGRSPGFYECPACDVQWYGGTTPLALSNGVRDLG